MERVEHLFVVRVWFEPGALPGEEWRGSVEHVPSGARRYFGALADLEAFIRRAAGGPVAVQREVTNSSESAGD
jgi:hypothetical protein